MDQDDDDYGTDIELDEELESILVTAEASSTAVVPIDIEDLQPRISPFDEFRRKGWLSVSDLVGTVWCEVQYDYRLRSMPYLPPSQRPTVITTKEGVSIPVDKIKVEDKERILRRGEKIHKRLEREIHPEEIVVHAVTREDVWGLRFLNMFSALEALLTLGKCRELPVVGFVNGVLIKGVIDEITRKPIGDGSTKPNTRSSAPDKSQTSLTSFFSAAKPRPIETKRERTHRLFVSDSKTRASGTVPNESDTLAGRLQVMLYKELLDALLLPSKEDLDESDCIGAILPTETPFSWKRLFAHLDLDGELAFSDAFIVQSRPILVGNGLRYDMASAVTLNAMVTRWNRYVDALGLGTPAPPKTRQPDGQQANLARSEDRLELVYRRAGAKHRNKSEKSSRQDDRSSTSSRSRRKKGSSDRPTDQQPAPPLLDIQRTSEDDDLQKAIEASLLDMGAPRPTTTADASAGNDASQANDAEHDADDDELAWAVEMSLGATTTDMMKEDEGEVVVRASQVSASDEPRTSRIDLSPAPSTPSPPSTPTKDGAPHRTPANLPSTTTAEASAGAGSGSIIGRTVFTHSPRRLATHLASVLDWWMGGREAVGVSIENTRRCGWCEFEEGCEWRNRKAREAMEKSRALRDKSHAG